MGSLKISDIAKNGQLHLSKIYFIIKCFTIKILINANIINQSEIKSYFI